MDTYNSDTIFMIVKMMVSLLVIVGIPIIINRIMIKKKKSAVSYQVVPVVVMLVLAAIFWFVVKDMIF